MYHKQSGDCVLVAYGDDQYVWLENRRLIHSLIFYSVSRWSMELHLETEYIYYTMTSLHNLLNSFNLLIHWNYPGDVLTLGIRYIYDQRSDCLIQETNSIFNKILLFFYL